MPGTGQVRWGIIGTARIARKAFVPAVAAAGGVVTTVAGRELARASQYAAETGIGRAVQGYQTLVDDPDVDALYVPLPNALHAEWTTRALRAGKPVLCEKPLCGSLAETEQVLAVARETGTPLWEAFVFPFHEQMAKVRGLLADGAIGELREIQSNFHFVLDRPDDFRLRRDMAGGALNDVGCYPVRLAVELFTGELESAWATATLGGDGVEVDLQGSVGYSGHQRLTLSCGFLRSDDRFTRLLGTTGQIHITDPFHPGPDDSFTLFEAGKEPLGYASTDEVPSFTAAIRHIQRVVRGQEEPRHLAVDNSLPTARALDALREAAARSAAAGRPGEPGRGEPPGAAGGVTGGAPAGCRPARRRPSGTRWTPNGRTPWPGSPRSAGSSTASWSRPRGSPPTTSMIPRARPSRSSGPSWPPCSTRPTGTWPSWMRRWTGSGRAVTGGASGAGGRSPPRGSPPGPPPAPASPAPPRSVTKVR